MRSRAACAAAALVMVFAAAGGAAAQEAEPHVQLFFGPRLGVSGVLQWPTAFTSDMQGMMHDSRSYFPVFTEMGIEARQLFPLGRTWGFFTLTQTLLIGGLEQRMPLPSASMTLGYRMPFGLELGIGPLLVLAPIDGNPGFAVSIVYTAGWTFATPDFELPVTLMFAPVPGYLNPRITVLSGINFWALQ